MVGSAGSARLQALIRARRFAGLLSLDPVRVGTLALSLRSTTDDLTLATVNDDSNQLHDRFVPSGELP
jgi:hypothetical protein